MFSVLLDKNGYFTGSYAEVGEVEGGITVNTLPEDMEMSLCYRLIDDNWILDETKQEEILIEKAIADIRKQRIEAFILIDKYQLTLVYETLTDEQKEELALYRNSWLDAPTTKIIPDMPEWME